MPRGYVELDLTEVQGVLWDFKFSDVIVPSCMEHVFERHYGDTNYGVRVYSSIDRRSDESRSCGSDAIRVVIWDYVKDRPAVEHSVYRTQNAVTNMLNKCKELWSYIHKNRCPNDGGLMIERRGPHGTFMGCNNFPSCKNTKPVTKG